MAKNHMVRLMAGFDRMGHCGRGGGWPQAGELDTMCPSEGWRGLRWRIGARADIQMYFALTTCLRFPVKTKRRQGIPPTGVSDRRTRCTSIEAAYETLW